MVTRRLQPDWPTRQLQLAVAGVNLQLHVPDNPYALLDLPAVEHAFNLDEYMPYWAHLWPASFLLADWLIGQVRESVVSDQWPVVRVERNTPIAADHHPLTTDHWSLTTDLLPPASVLEIGCGLGLTGLLAARLGYRVTLSDYDPDALDYGRRNARLNRVKVRVAELDWRQPPGDRYTLILGADVLYEQRNHQPILEMLRQSLVAGGLAAIADPCRGVCDTFLRDAHAAGWQSRTLQARWEETEGRIFLLRR